MVESGAYSLQLLPVLEQLQPITLDQLPGTFVDCNEVIVLIKDVVSSEYYITVCIISIRHVLYRICQIMQECLMSEVKSKRHQVGR